MEIKPGIKTTEFWLTAVKSVLTILLAAGVVTQVDADNLGEAVGAAIAAVGVFAANAVVVMEYIKSRRMAKTGK
jgi:hypothetical protein